MTNHPAIEHITFISGVPANGKCSFSWTSIIYLKHGILSYFFNSFHKSLLITFKAPNLHGYNHHSQSLVSGLIAYPCPLLIDLVQLGKSRQYCVFPPVPHSFLLQMKTAPSLFSRLNSITLSYKQLTHVLLQFKVIECAKILTSI